MNATIFVPCEFRASHGLPVRPEQHWHTYRVVVGLRGPVSPNTGFVADIGRVLPVLDRALKPLDNTSLNGHATLRGYGPAGELAAQFPTCEAMAHAFASALATPLNALERGVRLVRVEVQLLDDGSSSEQEYGWAVVELE